MVKNHSISVQLAALGIALLMNLTAGRLCCASVPNLINLQGRLTDVSGNPIQSPTQVEIRMFQGGDANSADSGAMVYREIATITPGPDGAYAYLLGSGSAFA